MTSAKARPMVYYCAAATNGRDVFGAPALFRDLNLPPWLAAYEHTFSNLHTPRRLSHGAEFLWQSWRLRASHGLGEPLKQALATVQLRIEINMRRIVDVPALVPLLGGETSLGEPITLSSDHALGGEFYGFGPELYTAASAGSWVGLIEKCVPCDCRVPIMAEAMRDTDLRGAIGAVWRLGGDAAVWAATCKQPEIHAPLAPTPGRPTPDGNQPFLLWVELVGVGKEAAIL